MREGPVTEEEIQEYLDLYLYNPPKKMSPLEREVYEKERLLWKLRFREYGVLERVQAERDRVWKPVNEEIEKNVALWLAGPFAEETRQHLRTYTDDEELIEFLIGSASRAEMMAEMSTGVPRGSARALAIYLWETRNDFSLVNMLKFESVVEKETREDE